MMDHDHTPARRSSATRTPHKLDLYRLAVQSPWVSVNLLMNMYASLNPGRWARRLREDFAGAAALATAWVAHDHDHRAVAIDHHGPTVRFARRYAASQLDAAQLRRIAFHQADVTAIAGPRADITAALNFSVNIHHQRDGLLAYFRHARRQLAPGGIFVCDAYGGPGAWRVGKQKRRVRPAKQEGVAPFDYQWEQRAADPLTGRVENHIHFKLADGRRIDSAFIYHWRLWSIPELVDALAQAGFTAIEVWTEDAQGQWGPAEHIAPCDAFLAYVVAQGRGGKSESPPASIHAKRYH